MSEFGRYQLEYGLGSGGSGTVFAARHTRLGRLVAVKVVRSPPPAVRERVLREARVQAQLHHSNILAVHDVIEQGPDIAIVMDLVNGPDLGVWLRQTRPFMERLAVFHQVLAGVGAAHAKGLVHRDLKPANVLVDLDGGAPVARVADFGLVFALGDVNPRITKSGVIMGTPPYMAPEQFQQAKDVDERADIFALGCILYELACGQMAFPQTDFVRLVVAVDNEAYADPQGLNPSLSPAVVRVIRDCLRADRTARPPSCSALAERLRGVETDRPGPERVRAGVPLAVEPGPRPSAAPPFPTSVPAEAVSGPIYAPTPATRGRLYAGVLASMLIVASVGWFLWGRTTAAEPAIEPAVEPGLSPMPEATVGTATEVAGALVAPLPPSVEPAPLAATKSPPAPSVASSARVQFAGDATEMWLQRGRTRYAAGTVPAGTYRVWASFGGNIPYEASIVELTAGKSHRLFCQASFKGCALE